MPVKGHHRSRSSIDRVIDLLADLEDNQIAILLDDLNHTTSSNVPVSEAIALFEHHATKPKGKLSRCASPVMALQVELERRHSKRLSSAPARFKIPSYEPPARQQNSIPSSISTLDLPTVSPTSSLFSDLPADLLSAADHFPDRPDHPERPSVALSPPLPVERPKSSAGSSSGFRPRSYKRISRPTFLSPTATAELHLLLLAFFNDNHPPSATTTATASPATPSPTTPQFFGMSHSLFSDCGEPEPCTPGLDLLEPSPMRTPSFSSSGRSLRMAQSMGSIFEVMRSQ